VDCAALGRELEGRGFHIVQSLRQPVASGKAFWMGLFERTVGQDGILRPIGNRPKLP
jgi:hypothetical protein